VENQLVFLLHICNNASVKKQVIIDNRADKEIKRFPRPVQLKFRALFILLERDGFLSEPSAKKISSDLFEIRVKYKGQWRAIYAYVTKTLIIILTGFNKKTQKTPVKEINKAKDRLKDY